METALIHQRNIQFELMATDSIRCRHSVSFATSSSRALELQRKATYSKFNPEKETNTSINHRDIDQAAAATPPTRVARGRKCVNRCWCSSTYLTRKLKAQDQHQRISNKTANTFQYQQHETKVKKKKKKKKRTFYMLSNIDSFNR